MKNDSKTKEYPECSGNPDCCPENEGYGCCKPSPPLTDERKLELVSEARSLIRRANEILDYVYADAIKRQDAEKCEHGRANNG